MPSTLLAWCFLALTVPSLAVQSGGRQVIGGDPARNLPFSPAIKAGDLIYVSGALATDEHGEFQGGDVATQTRRVLDNLSALLERAGSSMANAASVYVYLKHAGDFEAMNAVYRTYWPKDPPARTTVITNLANPDALVEIGMIALPSGADRQVVHPANWNRSPSPYSYGIKSGNTLFLAGLVARDTARNEPAGGDIAKQTRLTLDNAAEVLKAAGMSFADVVSSRVFLADTATFGDMNTVYRTYFPKDPPARATVQTGLTSPQYALEITLTAVKAASHTAIVTPNEDGSPGSANPNFSSAVRADTRVFVAGMMGTNDANKGDAKAQTREALARIGRTLDAAGVGWSHVVDAVVYLRDIKDFGAMNEVYREVLKADPPARATVETGLVSPDGLVEIMVTAVR